jgi:hypothetical protein
MKKIIFTILILLLPHCTKPVEIEIDSPMIEFNIDSLIESNKVMADTFKIIQVEATENVKEIIEKVVYENKILREKVKVVERVVIRDTIWIKESEQKNFWGKTKTEKEVTQQTDSTQTVTETIE